MIKNRGSTLIEILVVTAAIGILSVLFIVILFSPEASQDGGIIHSSKYPFKVGEVVVIDGLNVTGQVNTIHYNESIVIFKAENGIITKTSVRNQLLRKTK
jgi:prepilin-type N-terminal cleavage/methylation domain-containing protein